MTTCSLMKDALEAECCGKEASTTVYPYKSGGGDIFAKGGSHLSHAEAFSGTKIQALITASECVDVMPAHNWQADERSPSNKFCAVGAFDGLQAMPIKGDGFFQTPMTGEHYMRTFVNTEITMAPNDPRAPSWYISTNPNKGGYGQPAPDEHEKLRMWGAMEVEQFKASGLLSHSYYRALLLISPGIAHDGARRVMISPTSSLTSLPASASCLRTVLHRLRPRDA